jgi:prepilin peptidase CpaA
MTMMLTDAIRLCLFPLLMAFAAWSDLFTMTISNRVSLILVAGFAILAALIGMNSAQVLSHVGAGFTVLAVTFTLFACGWIGGGDAKLAAATALWLGFDPLMNYLLYASLFGGGLTLLLLRFRAMPLPDAVTGQEWVMRLHNASSGVPYGIALAAAALAVYPSTIWMRPLGL